MTDLTIDFYSAAMLMEDTLDRFTLCEPVGEASYASCLQWNMKAFECFTPMNNEHSTG